MVDPELYNPVLLRLASEEAQLAALPPELIMFPGDHTLDRYISSDELPAIALQRPFPTISVLVQLLPGKQTPTVICLEGYKWLAAARLLNMPTIQCISRRPQPFKNWGHGSPNGRIHPIELAGSLVRLNEFGFDNATIKLLLNKKSDKTLARLLKMSRWSPEAKKLILSTPDQYPAKFLFSLASKRRTKAEIEEELHAVKSRKSGNRQHSQRMEKVIRFCDEKQYSDREKQVVFEVLEHLRILKRDPRKDP